MKTAIIIVMLAIAQSGLAQQFIFGLTAGGNLTTQFLHSEYEITDRDFEQIKTTPSPGFEFGVFTLHRFSKRISLTNTLDFAHLTYTEKNGFAATNGVGETIWSSDKVKKISNYLRIYPVLSYTFFDKLILGTGIQLNVLLESRTKLKGDVPLDFEDSINRYYKIASFSIPLRVGYQFSSFDLSLEVRRGIDNRITGKGSYIKEREGSIALKFNFYVHSGSK